MVATIIIPLSTTVFFNKEILSELNKIPKIFLSIGWLFLIVSLVLGLVQFIMNYGFFKSSRKILEKLSTDIKDMKKDMERSREGLEKWQATEGNAFLIFKRPEADMGLVVQSIDSIINRASQLEDLAVNSTEYQVGIDDATNISIDNI